MARSPLLVAVAVAWLGFAIHNVEGFSLATFAGPETLVPSTVTLSIAVWWWRARSRAATSAFLGWTALNELREGSNADLPMSSSNTQ